MFIIHSGHFYSASSSPLLLRGVLNYSIDTVPELARRSATGNCEWRTCPCKVLAYSGWSGIRTPTLRRKAPNLPLSYHAPLLSLFMSRKRWRGIKFRSSVWGRSIHCPRTPIRAYAALIIMFTVCTSYVGRRCKYLVVYRWYLSSPDSVFPLLSFCFCLLPWLVNDEVFFDRRRNRRIFMPPRDETIEDVSRWLHGWQFFQGRYTRSNPLVFENI